MPQPAPYGSQTYQVSSPMMSPSTNRAPACVTTAATALAVVGDTALASTTMGVARRSLMARARSRATETATAGGTIDSWSATQDPSTHRWSGDISVKVKSENHHVKDQKGAVATFTLDNTKVKLRKGVPNPPVAGDRAVILGKVTEVAKACTDQSAAGKITVRQVDVNKRKHAK